MEKKNLKGDHLYTNLESWTDHIKTEKHTVFWAGKCQDKTQFWEIILLAGRQRRGAMAESPVSR